MPLYHRRSFIGILWNLLRRTKVGYICESKVYRRRTFFISNNSSFVFFLFSLLFVSIRSVQMNDTDTFTWAHRKVISHEFVCTVSRRGTFARQIYSFRLRLKSVLLLRWVIHSHRFDFGFFDSLLFSPAELLCCLCLCSVITDWFELFSLCFAYRIYIAFRQFLTSTIARSNAQKKYKMKKNPEDM